VDKKAIMKVLLLGGIKRLLPELVMLDVFSPITCCATRSSRTPWALFIELLGCLSVLKSAYVPFSQHVIFACSDPNVMFLEVPNAYLY